MIYGAIDKKGHKSYTYLDTVFDAINNRQYDYNWLITGHECFPSTPQFTELLNNEYCWLTGSELTDIVKQEKFQWLWAVLSGFQKDIPLSEILKYKLPYADSYTGFWVNPLTLQHPLADIEIVAWDSTMTLLLSKEKTVVDDFLKALPMSQDLSKYNANITI